MDGISRTVGVGPTIMLGGRSLTVSGRILRHYAEIEAEIIRQRGNPFDLIRQMSEAMPDRQDMALLVVTRAFQEAKSWRTVLIPEIGDWLNSTWGGRCFRTWLAVRDNDPDKLTLEEVTRLYSDEYQDIVRTKGAVAAEQWDQSIENAVDQASGDDELGNLSGSPLSGVETNESQSPGISSSSPSQNSTTGTTQSSAA